MSLVIAPELVQGAAQDLAGIRSSLAHATATFSGPTTSIATAAQDEVSIAIASMFGKLSQEFQALSAHAQAFHAQFVDAMNASTGAYAGAEAANAQGFGAPTAPWQRVFATTTGNAQTVFAATQRSLGTLSGGLSAEFSQLFANPATFFGNIGNALQSVTVIGAPDNLASAVTPHTLGGITTAMGGLLGDTPINDVHVQVWQGLAGLSDFGGGTGVEGALVKGLANFAASPLSGVLIGFAGPVVSPGVQLFNNAGTIFADITGGNPAAAFTTLTNTPADVVNAFFNGATLNLDPLAPVFNPFVTGGSGGGEQLTGLSLGLGGLFSPGQVVTGAAGPMYNGVGGSMLNSLGMDLSFFPPDDDAGATLVVPPLPVGPIAATAGLIDIVGHALGGSLLG
jgi:hypothetical protein